MKNTRYLLIWVSFFIVQAEKNVVLIPFDESDVRDHILYPDPNNFWFTLKLECAKAGYALTTSRKLPPEKVYAVVAFNTPSDQLLTHYRETRKILYTWEPPTIQPRNFSKQLHELFDIVATWNDELVDGRKYYKFNYALAFNIPSSTKNFEEKKLCCMFAGNKRSNHPDELYSKRLSMIRLFEQFHHLDFDLYGPDWNYGYKVYRGFAQDKIAVMKNYKFCIVYENMCNIPGYITEKIFDAFSGGCVPVYWGAYNIADFIPPDCFIARERFESDEVLYQYLANMNSAEYAAYRAAIDRFFSSKESYQFSTDNFIRLFITFLDELSN